MKLFKGFDAVKFHQENLIFITHDEYIYYIYDPEYNHWRKHENAGNDHITVSNYQDVSKEELVSAMQGVFPKKETDFMRLCPPAQLCISDMLALLREDHADYLSDYDVYHVIHRFLLQSNICYKSFEQIQNLLENAAAQHHSSSRVIAQLKELSFTILGRDIFKKEIGIVDGHDSSSYFWIMPVRVIDYSNTNEIDHVAEMRSAEISIEEDDVAQYLTPFLFKHFDEELEANKNRIEYRWTDEDGKEHISVITGFEWYLTHNFFTFDSIFEILKDIRDTVDALSSGKETEYTGKLKIKDSTTASRLAHEKEDTTAHNANSPAEDDSEVRLVIDFYQRFLYRMEYMLKIGKENGYDLISFMGP